MSTWEQRPQEVSRNAFGVPHAHGEKGSQNSELDGPAAKVNYCLVQPISLTGLQHLATIFRQRCLHLFLHLLYKCRHIDMVGYGVVLKMIWHSFISSSLFTAEGETREKSAAYRCKKGTSGRNMNNAGTET